MGKLISNVSVVMWLLLAILVTIKSEESNLENILETILDPREQSLQRQALRVDLIRRVKQALQREELENQLVDYKRSLSSLAKWNNLPGKRNLESLARAGYIRTLPEDGSGSKRSISSLAKNGQLPIIYSNDDLKRGIQSLARNGELHFKRQNPPDVDYDEDYDKRNLASLAREYNLPFYKRNVASLAREGMKISGKRNVAALLRQDSYLTSVKDENHTEKPEGHFEDGKRQKRSSDYQDEIVEEFSNSDPVDYEDVLKENEKRFLGSVAKSGWFRPSNLITANKRHIGSLARLGWLPALRSVRRFNRSGRSGNSCDPRSFAANGQIEDNSIPEVPFELMEKVPKFYYRYRNN